jgi:hypothetical protein
VLKDHRDLKVLRVHKVQLALKVLLLDLQGFKVHKDLLVLQALKDHKVHKELLVLLVFKVLKVVLVQRVFKVHKDLQV